MRSFEKLGSFHKVKYCTYCSSLCGIVRNEYNSRKKGVRKRLKRGPSAMGDFCDRGSKVKGTLGTFRDMGTLRTFSDRGNQGSFGTGEVLQMCHFVTRDICLGDVS